MSHIPKTTQNASFSQAFNVFNKISYYVGVLMVFALSMLVSVPTSVMAVSGDYYGSGAGMSGDYYGSGASADYYGGGVSADYYGGGVSGDYYGTPSSGSGADYYDVTPLYSDYTTYSPTYNDCYSCGYSSPSYGYGGYSAPVYSYAQQPSYQYIPYNGSVSAYGNGGNTRGSSGVQYVSSSNTNANANENTNAITNTFNPTNNNDARINLVVYGGGNGTANNSNSQPVQNYQAYSPTTYSSNYVNGISYTGAYSYPTYPTPTYVPYASQNTGTNLGTPVSGVFLSQVPETGIGFGIKMTLFSIGLTLWSMFAAFMIARKKNGSLANKINAFKLANMQKKGIQG